MYHLPQLIKKNLQVIHKSYVLYYIVLYNTMQYDTIQTLRLKTQRKTLLITVTGIALKGQADLISTMVPLEVLVQWKNARKGNRKVV